MLRRVGYSILFFLTLNVVAVGDGLFSIDARADCGAATGAGTEKHHAPVKKGCDLPWSPGCTSAGPCLPTALIAPAPLVIPTGVGGGAPLSDTFQSPASTDTPPDHPPPRA